MNYLDTVNKILIRLRETQVTSVTETTYSTLIGEYVNQTKREVEDAWQWIALKATAQATTVSGDYRYVLTGIKERFTVTYVFNDTTNRKLQIRDSNWMTDQFNVAGLTGEPFWFDFAGVDDVTGDYQLDLYPIPNAVWTINIGLVKRQADLITDSTEILVPSYPIMLGALYHAIVERGEDGGLLSSEAYRDYQKSLGDAIAMDVTRSVEGTHDWRVN